MEKEINKIRKQRKSIPKMIKRLMILTYKRQADFEEEGDE